VAEACGQFRDTEEGECPLMEAISRGMEEPE
jgi:hypothetical protein